MLFVYGMGKGYFVFNERVDEMKYKIKCHFLYWPFDTLQLITMDIYVQVYVTIHLTYMSVYMPLTSPLKNEVLPKPCLACTNSTSGTFRCIWFTVLLVYGLYSRDNSSSVSTLVLARRVKTFRSNLAVSVNL